MKKLIGASLIFVLFFLVFATPAMAQSETVCFCHNVKNNPVTICTDNNGLINGHTNHVESGDDTLGPCEEIPAVPEFGLITGAMALLTSAGSYMVFKRGR